MDDRFLAEITALALKAEVYRGAILGVASNMLLDLGGPGIAKLMTNLERLAASGTGAGTAHGVLGLLGLVVALEEIAAPVHAGG